MILFLSQNENSFLEDFAVNFSGKYGIKASFLSIKNLYKNSIISTSCINNCFNSCINNINFDDIKICYLNSNLSFYIDMFEFENASDNEYSYQEWNAALLCLFGSANKTKFINPFIRKYDCSAVFESVFLFQKFLINIPEMFLTNNAENFLSLYEIYNNNLLIENVLSFNRHEKLFGKDDLSKLNKLYLSPYIFKRPILGDEIVVLMLGDEIYAYNINKKNNISIPIGLKEKLILLKNELNVSLVLYSAIYDGNEFYFYSINQSPQIEELVSLFEDNFNDIFSCFLLKEYKS